MESDVHVSMIFLILIDRALFLRVENGVEAEALVAGVQE
jgi:hypothetical protein